MGEFTLFEVPLLTGRMALSQMPGRSGDYQSDLATILEWRPDMAISVCEDRELAANNAAGLGADLIAKGVRWQRLAVPDYSVPDGATNAQWEAISEDVLCLLGGRGRVFVHCQGGCGRSGMVLLRLMVDAGEAPETAKRRLREIRPCAIETDEQFWWSSRTT